MSQEDLAKAMLGIAAWVAVAVLALIAVANWDALWGYFPVLAAVVIVWAIGEWIMNPEGDDDASS